MGENDAVPVVIIGRGPTGLTLGLRLACQGVRSAIIDPHEREVVDPGSKAVLIARHVMDVTWPLGVGEQIRAEGLAWTVGRTFVQGKEIRAARIPFADGLLPQVVNLTQERVEQLLLARLLREPLITLIDRASVTAVDQDGDGVWVEYVRDRRRHTLRADWAAGCDGSRSTMRKQLGIPFEGYGHDDNFLICDVRTRATLPPERHFHFDPPFNPARTVLIHPQPDSTVHVDWQVGPDLTDADEEVRSGGLDTRLRAILGDEPYSVRWATTYRFKQLRARRFRQGRCFLVGDAAHLTSPYGARGMNSGIADAENLAWRLAMVVNNVSTDRLLDAYETERIHASIENLTVTGRTARFMCPITFRDRVKQRLVLRAAKRIPAARRFVDSGSFYEPPRYPAEPAEAAARRGAAARRVGDARKKVTAGEIFPDARIKDAGSGAARLGELLRHGIAVLWSPGSDTGDGGIEDLLGDAAPGLRLTVIEISAATAPPAAHPQHHLVQDVDGTLQRLLRPDGTPHGLTRAVVLRPDAYVAAVVDIPSGQPAAERVRASLRETFPPPIERMNCMSKAVAITADSLPTAAAEKFRYSFGVQVGGLVWISGQVALKDGQIVGTGDVRTQAEQVFTNLKTVLEAAGCSLDDLIETTTYMTDRAYSSDINDVRSRYLTGAVLPTSTLLVVAGLARPEFLVEISAVARIPDSRPEA